MIYYHTHNQITQQIRLDPFAESIHSNAVAVQRRQGFNQPWHAADNRQVAFPPDQHRVGRGTAVHGNDSAQVGQIPRKFSVLSSYRAG